MKMDIFLVIIKHGKAELPADKSHGLEYNDCKRSHFSCNSHNLYDKKNTKQIQMNSHHPQVLCFQDPMSWFSPF